MMYVVMGYAEGCPWCEKAKALLTEKGEAFTYLDVGASPGLKEFLAALGKRTVPQIWHGTSYVGGFEALAKYVEVQEYIGAAEDRLRKQVEDVRKGACNPSA